MLPYSIEKLVSLFDEINDTMSQNLLQVSTEKNIALLIAGCLPYKEKRMPLLGSVDTSKRNNIENMKKSKINYLLTIPKSSKYPVCERYLEFLVDFMEVLELHICKRRLTGVRQDFIYYIEAHRSSFKNNSQYGWFPSTACFQKVLFKRYNCMGLKDWFVGSGTIAAGPVSQALEGRNYSRSMRPHKR